MPAKTVVHIDDDPGFRRTAKYLLGHVGYTVLSFRDGAEALRDAASASASAVVADSSGVSAAEELVRARPEMLYVVLSANPRSDSSTARFWIEKGNKDWLMDVVRALNDHSDPPAREPGARPERLDVFASLTTEALSQYRGKVVVVAGDPERVIGCVDTLSEAEEFAARTAPGRGLVRFVQGPPIANMSLAELEGR